MMCDQVFLGKENAAAALNDRAEKLKAGIRAKVEHPYRVINLLFGFVKVLYRGLNKARHNSSRCLHSLVYGWCTLN